VPRKKKADDAPQPIDATERGVTDTRGINDAVEGHFVKVVSGPHEGRYGTLIRVGVNPAESVLRTRDKRTDLLSVDYADLRPAEAGLR
jgi:hypothetical protein